MLEHEIRSKCLRSCLRIIAFLVAAECVAAAPVALAIVPPIPTVEPVAVPGNGVPFLGGASGDVVVPGYVETEFFVSGQAGVYLFGASGIEPKPGFQDKFYRTRILVRRPAHPAAFSGNVIIEILNPTLGFDLSLWNALHKGWTRNGDVWIGLTIKSVSLAVLKEFFDPVRYTSLDWERPLPACSTIVEIPPPSPPGTFTVGPNCVWDGLAWDILSQVGRLFKSPAAPLPAGFHVEQVYATGFSQTGAYLVTYINGFHALERMPDGGPIFDGYMIGLTVTSPARVDLLTSALPPALRRVQYIDVPVIHVNSQSDVSQLGSTQPPAVRDRQEDADLPIGRYRLWEVAGSSHVFAPRSGPSVFLPPYNQLKGTGYPLVDLTCQEPTGDFPLEYIFNAAFVALDRWVEYGIAPARATRIDLSATIPDGLNHDVFGNVTGGVRTPYVDVPSFSWRAYSTAPLPPPAVHPISQLICNLQGHKTPLTQAQLDALYKNHGKYVSQFARRAITLVVEGFFTAADAVRAVLGAVHEDIP
jgi:Alpha/beta hydrolase domain